eukprot:4907647-Pleurochrysis_carterae.AAC.2
MEGVHTKEAGASKQCPHNIVQLDADILNVRPQWCKQRSRGPLPCRAGSLQHNYLRKRPNDSCARETVLYMSAQRGYYRNSRISRIRTVMRDHRNLAFGTPA